MDIESGFFCYRDGVPLQLNDKHEAIPQFVNPDRMSPLSTPFHLAGQHLYGAVYYLSSFI
jgi:hypothetical protein